MDPVACWAQLVTACESGDMETAGELALALDGWRRKGGFRPEMIPPQVWVMGVLRDFARMCQAVAEADEETPRGWDRV